MNKVKYENKTIAYTVNRAKIKNFYITIQNGEVVIKAPRFATSSQIQNVVEAKRQWIMQKLQEYQQSPTKVKEYADGEKFQILGEAYYLNIYYKDINLGYNYIYNSDQQYYAAFVNGRALSLLFLLLVCSASHLLHFL